MCSLYRTFLTHRQINPLTSFPRSMQGSGRKLRPFSHKMILVDLTVCVEVKSHLESPNVLRMYSLCQNRYLPIQKTDFKDTFRHKIDLDNWPLCVLVTGNLRGHWWWVPCDCWRYWEGVGEGPLRYFFWDFIWVPYPNLIHKVDLLLESYDEGPTAENSNQDAIYKCNLNLEKNIDCPLGLRNWVLLKIPTKK